MVHCIADRCGIHLGKLHNAAILHTGEQIIDHIDIESVFPGLLGGVFENIKLQGIIHIGQAALLGNALPVQRQRQDHGIHRKFLHRRKGRIQIRLDIRRRSASLSEVIHTRLDIHALHIIRAVQSHCFRRVLPVSPIVPGGFG